MKAREYCVQLGLAKPGRGKLSANAHEAIKKAIVEGMIFDDYKDSVAVKKLNDSTSHNRSSNRNVQLKVTVPEDSGPVAIKSRPVNHDYSKIWGIDTRGRSPIKIAFQWCACCLVQIRYCSRAIPLLPEWIGGKEGVIQEPTDKEMSLAMELANVGR